VGAHANGPSGTVTFVLTDIEGSTKHAKALGDDYAVLIGRHHELLRAVWHAHDGYEVATEGDAFIVAFADADAGVLAAVDAQRRIMEQSWPGEREVRIRIGLHAGYARPVDGDYRALSLNQASRIVGCANGGQTFATVDVLSLVTERIGDVHLVPLGKYRVRDFDDPVQLHSVVAAGMPRIDAAPRVRPAEGHNIVPPTATLVGRDADVTALVAGLGSRSLTTITGPGGVGKTRLAVEVAIRAVPDWPDGVWFVDLTSLVAAEDVPSAIASAVGSPITPGDDIWPDVLTHLERRTTLVVLDNCEHVIDGVARLAHDLTARCEGVGVLATSRAPLGLIEERVHRVGPLRVGTARDPGVQLFLERASNGEQLRHDDVVALCRELDGLPLAIELAAARTTAITPREILARLRSTPALLHSRDPALPARQRSLTRSLGWSYGLLDAPARAVYRRLSAFASGFDLAAAELVCADDQLPADDVAELVWALVDASLVQLYDAAGATRYRMLRVVRSHGASLAEAEEAKGATRRLARLELDRVGPERPIDREWRSAMSVELDNVRQVVAALAASDDVEEIAIAQALVWSIGRYHDNMDAFRVAIGEVRRWVDALTAPTAERVALLGLLAELHHRLGERTEAERVLDQAVALAATAGLPIWDETAIDRALGEIALRNGAFDRAIAIANEALPRARTARGRCRLLNLLGIALSEQGDNRAAADVMREEIEAGRAAGMESFLVTSCGNLAEILLRCGDLTAAAASQLECLELSRSTGPALQAAFSMIVAAHLAAAEGAWARAVELQSAADVELTRVEWALYGADAERRRQLLDDARRVLGDATFATVVAGGEALGMDAAADIAAGELRRIAARRGAHV
jgi:predicted ATPase